jgi:hypothetical protein
MAKLINNGVQGITQVILKTKNIANPSLNRPLMIAAPSNGTYNSGVTETEITSVNCLGEQIVSDSYVNERKPTLSFTYGGKTKEVLAAFFGLELANGTKTTAFAKSIEVTAASYAASTSGYSGFGATANNTNSYAYYLTNDGIATELTRQTFGSFNPATPNSWAQGADGALLFSTDVVAARRYVTFYVPYDSTNSDYLSTTPQVDYTADIFFVNINKDVGHFIFDSVSANLTENAEFEFGGGEISLNFRVTGGFQLIYPNRLARC